jgi:hypothetical protein
MLYSADDLGTVFYAGARRLRLMTIGILLFIPQWILLSIIILTLVVCESAATRAASGCDGHPEDHWTPTESWVLHQLCDGQIADFNRRAGETLDPSAAEGWTTDRELSADFLRKLLLNPDYQEARAQGGVRIIGAWMREKIDWEGAKISSPLWLEHSRFDAPLILDRAQLSSSLELDGSHFGDAFRLSEVEVAGALLATQADFRSIDLRGAWIGREVDLEGAQVHDRFDATEIQVGRFVNLRDAVLLADVVLARARIGGSLRVSGAHLVGTLDTGSVAVKDSVEAWGVQWIGVPDWLDARPRSAPQWHLYNAEIGGSVYLSGASLQRLKLINLTGTHIGKELFLGSRDHVTPNTWGAESRMILRNTVADSLQDQSSSWPHRLELSGFTYQRWGGLEQETQIDQGVERLVPARGSEWLTEWLSRDRTFSSQPYEQLARVLRKAGRNEGADDILFAGREAERKLAVAARAGTLPVVQQTEAAADGSQPAPQGDSRTDRIEDADASLQSVAAITLSCLFNGYGYRPERALLWFMVLILIGTPLFRLSYRTPEGKQPSMFYSFEYTLDTLLPAVSLRRDFDDVKIEGWSRYYFIFLKVCGYMFVATIIQIFDKLSRTS